MLLLPHLDTYAKKNIYKTTVSTFTFLKLFNSKVLLANNTLQSFTILAEFFR